MSLSEIRCTTVCGSCAPMWDTDYNQSITDTTDLNLCLKHAACLQSQFLPLQLLYDHWKNQRAVKKCQERGCGPAQGWNELQDQQEY